MTTVVNNPGSGEGMGMGFIIGIVVAIVVVVLVVFYGLPALRTNQAPKENSIDVNIKLPTGENKVPENSPQQ